MDDGSNEYERFSNPQPMYPLAETAPVKKHIKSRYLLLLLSVGVYLAFSVPRIFQPVAQDELHWLVAAKNLYRQEPPQSYINPLNEVTNSPHLYLRCLELMFVFFGEHEWVARVPGILSGLLSILLVFIISRSYIRVMSHGGDSLWPAVVTLLYATTPALIQGSAIIDIDNTILVPAVLLLLWIFTRFNEEGHFKWGVFTVFAVAAALWGRVTTPAILIVILAGYISFQTSPWKSKLFQGALILSGIMLFLLSWAAYGALNHINILGPFQYTIDSFRYRTQTAGGFKVFQFMENGIYLTLWLGLFNTTGLFFMAGRGLLEFFRNPQLNKETLFLFSGLAIVAGYCFVGGCLFGFPKYHSPGIPLLYIVIAVALARQNHDYSFGAGTSKNRLILVFLVFLATVTVLPDLLYLFRYQLREASAMGRGSAGLLQQIGIRGFIYITICAGLFFIAKKHLKISNVYWLWILFAVGSNLGVIFIQNGQGYQTGYNYGARGILGAAQFVRAGLSPEGGVVAPSEIIYYLDMPRIHHLLDRVWNNPDDLKEHVLDSKTEAFVDGVPINTVSQLKVIRRDPSFQALLNRYFDKSDIGSFEVWIRKK